MTAILNLAVALLAGLLMTRIFSRWHLPDVTAFLVTGVQIGPFVLGRRGMPGRGFASYDQGEALSMISDVAMGFIAYSIGNEFRLSQLNKTGRQAMIIGVLQALDELGSAYGDGGVTLISFDAGRTALSYCKDGKIDLCAECNPLHGPRVRALIEQLARGETPEKLSYMPEALFTADTLTAELLESRVY